MLIIGLVSALIAAFSWAVSAAFYKVGAKDISPLTANLIRIIPPLILLGVGALFFNLYWAILSWTPWQLSLIFGSSLFAFVLADALYFVTIQNIGVSRGVAITAIYPLFVLIIQVLFLAQPVHLLIFPAVVITISGVAILGSRLHESQNQDQAHTTQQLWIGFAAAITTALCWSISIFFLDAVLETTNLVLVAIIRLVIALVILSPIVFGQQLVSKKTQLTRRKLLFLGTGGLIALSLGYIGFAIALQTLDTTSATVLSSLTPLFALIIGWRSLKEQVTWRTVIGVVACVVGVILIGLAVSLL